MSKYGFNRKGAIIAETPDQLALEEEHAAAVKSTASKRMAELMGDDISRESASSLTAEPVSLSVPLASPLGPSIGETQAPSAPLAASLPLASSSSSSASSLLQQNITIGKNGKKRIQPQF